MLKKKTKDKGIQGQNENNNKKIMKLQPYIDFWVSEIKWTPPAQHVYC